ncbi:MAG: phosphatidate cytidylyltransferase [Proteobacteria bacterium]|nr:phosphatidate cytidylyltransferase [Pseudomonadota bacterium]
MSSLIFLPLFISLLIYGTTFHFMLLVAAAALIGLGEFFSFKEERMSFPLRLFAYIWSALIFFGALLGEPSYILGTLVGGVFLALLIRLKNGEKIKGVVDELGFLFLGIFYVSLLISYLILLRGLDEGALWVLLLFVITWSGDTSAYFAGRSFGRRKFFEAVSPKKSVEGFIGGFLGGIGASIIFKGLFFQEITLADSIIVGAVIGVLGPLGDLCESLFKRSCEVKDSGVLIPGHGGILDRIDSILFSTPFVYYFATMNYGAKL